jgi:hypothetical protein
MSRLSRFRPSPAMMVALVALFVAMGGVSYAALLAPNSVGPKQLKKNAVRSAKVKDGSLKAVDFAAGQLPAGPKGDQGPKGEKGERGPAGVAAAYARIGATGTLDPGTPPQNKGVVQENVEHDATTGVGVYCFGGLPFTPTSAMVSVDSAMAVTTSNQIAAIAVQRGNNLNGCDATHQQARVSILQVNNTEVPKLVDHGFYIWFEAE